MAHKLSMETKSAVHRNMKNNIRMLRSVYRSYNEALQSGSEDETLVTILETYKAEATSAKLINFQ